MVLHLISPLFFLSLLGISVTESVEDVKPKSMSILFLGDSLTEGYGIEEEQTYVALLEQKWRQEGLTSTRFINGGVSGSTSASAMSRLRWFERQGFTHLVLALGANDGLRGLPLERTRENLQQAISWATERSIPVILAGMQLPPNYGEEYTKNFRQMFLELSQKNEGVELIPFLLEGVAAVEEYNLPDGIHPNPRGHQKMAEVVEPFLRRFLP